MFDHKIFLFLILASCYRSGLGPRVKRVIGGTRVIGRRGPYDAVRYMVGIGSVHGVPFYTLGFHDSLKELGAYGTINCGGALLIPTLIQTACHCVASFDYLWVTNKPRINAHWESVRVIYIGINDRFGEPFSMLTKLPVKSQEFIMDVSCEKLPSGTTLENISHDFGWIKIDPSWIKGDIGVPTSNVIFAPVYQREKLERIYWDYLKNPPVCLILGYGIFEEEGDPSDFLRAGWSHLMYEYLCRPFTCVNLTDSEVEKYKTWVCSEEFPKYYQPPFKGDSGSPLTCNNAYFGIASQSLKQTDGSKFRRIGTYSALYFAAPMNTLEKRAALVEDMNRVRTDTYVDKVRRELSIYIKNRRMKGATLNHSNIKPDSPIRLLSLQKSSAVNHVSSGLLLVLFLIALHTILFLNITV